MSVTEYLNQLPAERKAAVSQVRRLVKQHLPSGYVETIQYGMITYVVPLRTFPDGYLGKKDVPLPYLSLASQKSHMALYLMGLYGDPKLVRWFTTSWKATGKKLDMGKACLRFTSVDALAVDVLGEAIGKLPVAEYVAQYEAAQGGERKSAARAGARAPKPAAAKARPRAKR